MDKRERFRQAMKFKDVDRLPLLFWSPWAETVTRWQKEGMKNLEIEFTDYDAPMQNCWLYDQFQGPIPGFKEKTITENEHYLDIQNSKGQIERRLKSGTSMPCFIDYPIKNTDDWQKYKKRLNPDSFGRYPKNWPDLVLRRKNEERDDIRGVTCWGFYGFPREMLGPERLSLFFYDEPQLITEMNEYWLFYTIKRLEKGLKEMDFDYALIWEDNCYKHGLLHSPKIFKQFMAPFYRKLIDFFQANGIEIISVDSDGNVLELIPLLLDVGVTSVHPFEVGAGMDVVQIGRKYPELQIWGGIDKRALAKDKETIDKELKRVLLPMKKRGGYAAGLDHLIPSDVSLENHRYYVKKLKELCVL